MKWTPSQERVINERGKNILVSAAAGSGKTAVLTERILTLLREGEDITKFLVITFTNASAKDMREKIHKALRKDPSLKDALRALPQASIQTIDSFCRSVVLECFHYLDVDPSVSVGSDTENAILEAKILDDLFEAYYDEERPSFLRLVERFSDDRSDEPLRNIIRNLDRELSNHASRELAVEEMIERLSDRDYWKSLFEARIDGMKREALELSEEALTLSYSEKMEDFLKEEQKLLENLPQAISFATIPRLPKGSEELKEDHERIKDLRNRYKKLAQESILYTDESFEREWAVYEKQKEDLKDLIELTEEYHERFFIERKEEGLLSFQDFEALALEALKVPMIQESFRERYDYIFIDEYQDTNRIQEAIVTALKRTNNVFMVGDLKQSIYRFRQADPTLFLEKYDSFQYSDDSVRIDLNQNFRSSPGVIDGVNHLFKHLFCKDFGGIEYDDNTKLIFGNESLKDIEDPVEILITKTTTEDKDVDEVRSIIKRIYELRREGYRYKDIVVLFRSTKRFKDLISKEFSQYGIPVYMDSSTAYLKSLEVDILLNYLKVIDNFKQDLAILSLLRLPRYALTDQEIYDFRKEHEEMPIYEAIKEESKNEEVKKKIAFFLDEIRGFRHRLRSVGIDELLEEIFYETELETFILAMPQGEQRIANVHLLFKLAREYEETSFVGLGKFLNYLDELVEREKDFESAKTLSEDSDTVRVMSIHKSKGLQFPVVILGNLEKLYNEMDTRGPIIIDGSDMVALDIDLETRTKTKPLFKRMIEDRMKEKNREEEVRLFYVALTRAEKRLILSFATTDIEKLEKKAGVHSLGSLKSARSYLDLFLGCGVFCEGGLHPSFTFTEPEDVTLEAQKRSVRSAGKLIERKILKERKLASKISVSKLLSEERAHTVEIEVEEQGGSLRGTAFHKAMQWIDVNRPEESLKELMELGVLKDFDEKELLESFLTDERFVALLKDAKGMKRELPFVYRYDVEGETTLLQGIIDLVLEYEEGVVLIDYKTDLSTAYVERYKEQLRLYATSYEAIKKTKVLKKLLWFVRLKRFVEVE
ncbi:UvrD-helicase domain-containing protein [Guggenheimella bovis]